MKKVLTVLMIAALGMTSFAAKPVQMKGSDTMINLGQAMAEEYMKANKGARIAVTGGGSGIGIAAIMNNTTDIAQASREIKAAELDKAKANGVNVKETVVAFDGIAVVVNPKNGVNKLNLEQIRAIYIGEVKNWKEIGGVNKTIVVLSRESSSGTHVYFKEHVLRKGNEKGPEEYRNDALFMPSTQAIVDEVAKNDAAIGYIGLGYLEEAGAKIKDVKVNGIEPKVATVKNKTYPISRPLYWYTNGEPKGEVKALVDYALGAEGKKVILKEGFVPLN